ncbi:MAG: methyltransferase domain-containing protein [Thermoplasmata archaeon]
MARAARGSRRSRPERRRAAPGGGRTHGSSGPARNLGDHPEVYDAAFGWDRTREARRFLDAAEMILARPPKSVAELACGTGALARRWAQMGLDVIGVDRNPVALRRARELTQREGSHVAWVRSDLRSFRLPRPVDVVALPLDGLTYLVGRRALRSFFKSARLAVGAEGVVLMDATLIPRRSRAPGIRDRWTVRVWPRGRLTVEWRSFGRVQGHPRRRDEVARMELDTGDGVSTLFAERAPHSVLSADEVDELARSRGPFRRMGVFSSPAHHDRSGAMKLRRRFPSAPGAHLVALWG